MLQLVAQINASHLSGPSSIAKPLAFSPPSYAVWVNSLWFLSFVISLTYAMLATMMHQWAGHYITTTQQLRYGPRKKARLRAFFSDAVGGSLVLPMVRSLRAMIHLSLFLFFAGLIIFLYNTHNTVFIALISWMALSITAYMYITVLPILRPNSPYKTPFSSLIWRLFTGLAYVTLEVLTSPLFRTGHHFRILKADYYKRFVEGSMRKRAEKTALQRSSEIDARVLISMLAAVDEDDSPEEFFKAVAGFFNSDQVGDLEEHLLDEFRTKFMPKLNSFLARIFSSNSVSEPVRSDQFITCLNATHAVLGPDGVSQILYDVLSKRWGEVSPSFEMGHSLRGWGKNHGDEFTPFVRRIITQIIIGIRERDDRWIKFVVDEFGVPDDTLRANIRHGDSALLSLLIHVTRQASLSSSWTPFTLALLTEFDICETLPELQHEFCLLWNKILRDAHRDGVDSTAIQILREIRRAYIELHQGTDAAPTAFSARTFYYNPILEKPLSYRFCTITEHRQALAGTNTSTSISTSNPSLAQSATAQRGGSPDPSNSSSSLQSQQLISRSDEGHVAHTAQPQAERASINPSTSTPSEDVLPGSSAQTLYQRRTFRSISPFSPPVQIAPQVNSAVGLSVPESIRPSAVDENTLDPHLPVSTEVPSYPQQPTLSASDIATNGVRPHELTPRICPSETEDAAHALATTSLISAHPNPHSAPDSSIQLRVHSFSHTGPVLTSSCPTDGSPPVHMPGSRPDITVNAMSSYPLKINGHPTILKEDKATPPEATFICENSSTPQSVPARGATPQRNEGTALPPPIRVPDSHSLLPLQYEHTLISAVHDSAP